MCYCFKNSLRRRAVANIFLLGSLDGESTSFSVLKMYLDKLDTSPALTRLAEQVSEKI